MYVSMNIPVDAGATCCNVLGDIACAVAMKRTCKLPGAGTKQEGSPWKGFVRC